MSDRDRDRSPRPGQPAPPPRDPGPGSATPLLWILVLLALLAFGWFIYNERAGAPVAPPAPPIGVGDAAGPARDGRRPKPVACASASKPGNEVATLATSAISTSPRATCAATANAIAMR